LKSNGLIRKLRGKRGGKCLNYIEGFKSNERPYLSVVKPRRIDVISPRLPNHDRLHSLNLLKPLSYHNPSNCIYIPTKPQQKPAGSAYVFVPSFMLSNVMSLAPKIDEIREVINHAYLDFVCITETWPRGHIADNIIAISGFNVIRRDRVAGLHGGVFII
jgi:hypothetical protein